MKFIHRPSDNTSGTENVSVVQDPESVIETGASSADDEEKVPFAFDMSNRVSILEYFFCFDWQGKYS